jgi:predicted RecA/RadA family phage recombinase
MTTPSHGGHAHGTHEATDPGIRDPELRDFSRAGLPPEVSLLTVQPAPVAVRVGDGDVIEYFSTAGQNAGDVIVLGTFVGITVQFCIPNSWVTLFVTGRFDIAKTTGTTANLGDKIYYSVATKTVSNSAGGVNVGYCSRAAVSGDSVIRVNLWPNFA